MSDETEPKPVIDRRPSKPKMLAASLPGITKAAYRRRGFAVADVLTNWPAIVGEALAAQSCPESLTFPPEKTTGGTLRIRVEGPLAIELQHLTPLVIERINSYYGFRAVERLSFIQGPMPKPPARKPPRARPLTAAEERILGELVAGTGDPALRDSLLALGRQILGQPAATAGKKVR